MKQNEVAATVPLAKEVKLALVRRAIKHARPMGREAAVILERALKKDIEDILGRNTNEGNNKSKTRNK